ncbi:hypothetical protein PRIC2_010541 [Phytophthora ramorum]
MSVSIPRQYVTSTEQLQSLLAANGGKPVLSRAKVIGVHFQFADPEHGFSASDRVVAVTVGSNSPDGMAVVLQIESLKQRQVVAGLTKLLEDADTIKVMINVARVARWLQRYGRESVLLANCLDLQLMYQAQTDAKTPRASLTQISSHYGSSAAKMGIQVDTFSANLKPRAWTKSPLNPPLLRHLVDVVKTMVRCYHGNFGTSLARCEAEVSPLAAKTRKLWGASYSSVGNSSVTSNGTARENDREDLAAQVPNGEHAAAANLPLTSIQLVGDEREVNMSFQSAIVGVHFQFATQDRLHSDSDDQADPEQLVAITLTGAAPSDPTVVLQIASLQKARVITWMKTLFSNSAAVKVMHNIHRAAFWLDSYGLQDAKLVNCFDLQLYYENAVDTRVMNADILQIATQCFPDPSEKLVQSMYSFKTKLKPVDAIEWKHTPLSAKLLQTLAQTTKLYVECYVKISPSASLKASCAAMTNLRWQNSVVNHGCKAIWFDPGVDNQARSLECLVSNSVAASGDAEVDIKPLKLQCELEPLLKLLPTDYQDAIMNIADYRTKLVDVCLDVGRIPHVYTGKKQRVVLSKNNEVVSKDTIDEIVTNLGGEMRIGDDNRAGIDRQLHRISVMRSKTDEVYGLTMRVGRALLNAACVLTDLLLSERHADKSVLVLGHPGSGKTTLIRDVARCVSETMENVCIIDTSNEIGGDGLVPHACVGWARRMMVRSLEAQAGVMVECVQNHTVETLIVDEIGRKAEVLAASTVRQRGPRLIASAHGDFRALIKNPDLKGLVGGSQQVIVGDGAAAKSASKSKLQTQRAGNPIFDVIVELDHVVRGRCRIIWDVAKAVDSVFEGNDYSFEARQWDSSTSGVQVVPGS